jgi:hypothetical protein
MGANAFDNLVNTPSSQVPTVARVQPGASGNSYLWAKLQGTQVAAGGQGVQMPKTGSLTATELATIQVWIDGGALP